MHEVVAPQDYDKKFTPRVERPRGIPSRVAYCAGESRRWMNAHFPIQPASIIRRIDLPQEVPTPKASFARIEGQ
jgi:hypothetical protein